jgi:hypothetical protein
VQKLIEENYLTENCYNLEQEKQISKEIYNEWKNHIFSEETGWFYALNTFKLDFRIQKRGFYFSWI